MEQYMNFILYAMCAIVGFLGGLAHSAVRYSQLERRLRKKMGELDAQLRVLKGDKSATYALGLNLQDEMFIECLRCGLKSYNTNDIRERYCANCHLFHEEPKPPPPPPQKPVE